MKCQCYPKGDEKRFRIAAKATPRTTITKAGQVLHAVVGAVQAGVTWKKETEKSKVRNVSPDVALTNGIFTASEDNMGFP